MAKLHNGIGYAKIDSIALVIPESEILHNGSAIGKPTWEIDGDSVLVQERKNKPSQQFEKDGIKFTVQKSNPLANEKDYEKNVANYIIPLPSKILGVDEYDQGFTLNNFEKAAKWMENATGIKFKKHAWENARFRDMDNALDKLATPAQWSNELQEIWERIEPETRNKYGLLFKTKSGLVHGLQMNTRQKEAKRAVTAKFPFLKLYDKALEIQEMRKAGSTWGMEYKPGERKRFESQIRNNYWKEDPILQTIPTPRTWVELLTVCNDQNHLMTKYATEVLHRGYVTRQAKPKTKRDMSKEGPREWILNEWIQMDIEQQGLPLDQRDTPEQRFNKLKARADIFHREKAHRIRKMADDIRDLLMPADPNQGTLNL